MSARRVRAVVCALALGVVATPAVAAAAPAHRAHAQHHVRGSGHDVIANLWEWNWRSVARECTNVLGPAGYGGVQVAPPQDSLSRSGPAPVHPWWEVYQPVDYNLTSRMGNEAQFKSMVTTCRRAGVKVIVDAVINHMTGQGDTSYGGVHYTKYAYAGIYTPADFHVPAGECPTGGDILDFNNYLQVVKCELVSLSDLRTETEHVRATVAAYLNKLIGYGVSGFRVDAAKHLGQTDLAAIEARLHRTLDGERPYIALEVPPGGPGKLSPWAFRGVGRPARVRLRHPDARRVQELRDAAGRQHHRAPGAGRGLGPAPERQVARVRGQPRHRAQRLHAELQGRRAQHAGHRVHAGRRLRDARRLRQLRVRRQRRLPTGRSGGYITDTNCASGWVCTDRTVANLVGWHNYAGDAPQANWYDDGVNLIAFSRGHRAWIAINNEDAPVTRTFATGLAPGRYCDVIHGDAGRTACTRPGRHGRRRRRGDRHGARQGLRRARRR